MNLYELHEIAKFKIQYSRALKPSQSDQKEKQHQHFLNIYKTELEMCVCVCASVYAIVCRKPLPFTATGRKRNMDLSVEIIAFIRPVIKCMH